MLEWFQTRTVGVPSTRQCSGVRLQYPLHDKSLRRKAVLFRYFELDSQVNTSKETACRARLIRSVALPFVDRSHSGDVSRASCPDFCSSAYGWAVGFCGEPVRFHASKALLCCRSIR